MSSLVELFEKQCNSDKKEMRSVLEKSGVDVDYIMGFPVWTFWDGSHIYFTPEGYCTSNGGSNARRIFNE